MKAVPIDDDDPVLQFGFRRTYGPPPGVSEEDCYTCEAVVTPGDKMGPETWLRIELEDDDDHASIAEHGAFYLILIGGGIPPFRFATLTTSADMLVPLRRENAAARRLLELVLGSSGTVDEVAERLVAEVDDDMLAILQSLPREGD